MRQAVNRLEDAGYVHYDDGLSVGDERVRDAARDFVAASAGVSPPSVGGTYVIPQFGDWPFAFTRIDAVYVWTQSGYQVGRDPDDYPLFLAVREQDIDAWEAFFDSFDLPTAFERRPREELTQVGNWYVLFDDYAISAFNTRLPDLDIVVARTLKLNLSHSSNVGTLRKRIATQKSGSAIPK